MTSCSRPVFAGLFILLLLAASGCDVFQGGKGPAQLEEYVLVPRADDIFPEGIAYSPLTMTFFVGSTTDGTIYRGRLGRPAARAFSEGGATAAGLALGRVLWVAGGGTGDAYAIDPKRGTLLATLSSPEAEATFLNDVAIAGNGEDGPPRAAYFTDSRRPVLFRAPSSAPAGTGTLEPWLDLTGTAISYEEGFNLNGIVSTTYGRYLIVVQSNTGQLFRIDTKTKAVHQIDLGGATVPNGDGLVLDGSMLYVIRNANAEIVPIELGDAYLTGAVGIAFGQDAGLLFPTTAAKARGDLLVVNGQLDATTDDGPVLPFTVSRVEIPQ